MRIENRSINSSNKFKKSNSPEKLGANFLQTLQEYESIPEIEWDIDNISYDDLKNLAGLIEQGGESLSNNPNPDNFNSYKKHIKLFISILKDNYEVKDTISRISFSKQKLYKTVETIDENLSKLAGMVLSNEKNRLNYLKLVNNIKGLIIDLIL